MRWKIILLPHLSGDTLNQFNLSYVIYGCIFLMAPKNLTGKTSSTEIKMKEYSTFLGSGYVDSL